MRATRYLLKSLAGEYLARSWGRQSGSSLDLTKSYQLLAATALAIWFVVADCRWAPAIDLEFLDGEVKGAFDTRVAIGTTIRVSDRDKNLVGIANGGKAYSVNGDDGNLNYDKGDLASLAAKVTHELELNWRNFSLFGRVFYFYDFAIMNLSSERTPQTDRAKSLAGRDFKLLDLYGTGDFELGNRSLTVRLGQQVINWGESTFIANGINAINPFDLTKLRVAGAEIRDALVPTPALDMNLVMNNKWSMEGFYRFAWDKTTLDPRGTFFSTSDAITPGSRFVVFGSGSFPDNPPLPGTFQPKVRDQRARDQGQFGFALRYFEPALNSTEFGLYYERYHSNLPVVGTNRVTTVGAPGTGSYFSEFPEDIDLLGSSFNTNVQMGTTSLALQGELSYRFNQPLQIDDAELSVAGLDLCGIPSGSGVFESQLDRNGSALGCGYAPGEKIDGFRRKNVLQAQATATYVPDPTLGANQVALIAEVGGTYVPSLPSKGKLRFEGPGTTRSGNPSTAAAAGTPVQKNGFATGWSWGYRLVGRLLYNNVLGSVNLTPQIAFSHDVAGTTPLPLGNFVEDRKAITPSLTATYLESWQATLSYTNFFGAGSFNLVNDRDNVTLQLGYAF